MSVAIVLIPQEHTRVWKISSEKIPHVTLLYLQDPDWGPDQLKNVLEFVRHTADMTNKIWAYPEDRGVLGEDEADVVFFSKRDNDRLFELRQNLLGNDEIRKANADSPFQNWIPHLTLGYPEAPAKEVDDSSQIFGVEFDRIAVWTENYEGVEYRFPMEDSFAEVTMTGAKAVEAYLSHYGVKGMKWGQRRARKPKVDTTRTQYTKAPKALSTAELKRRVDRMQTEIQYNKLNRREITEGERMVAQVLLNTGRRVVRTLADSEADRLVLDRLNGR